MAIYLSGLDGTVPEEDVLAESAFVQVPLHAHKTPVQRTNGVLLEGIWLLRNKETRVYQDKRNSYQDKAEGKLPIVDSIEYKLRLRGGKQAIALHKIYEEEHMERRSVFALPRVHVLLETEPTNLNRYV